MSLQPFPMPDDWSERWRVWPSDPLARFRDLIAYPAFRRLLPGFSGDDWAVPLSELAAIDAGPEPSESEVQRISTMQDKLRKHPFALILDLEVADGASAATTLNRLLLRAHRALDSNLVGIRLWWPRRTDWRWFVTMQNGDASQIAKAFETGEVPPDLFPGHK